MTSCYIFAALFAPDDENNEDRHARPTTVEMTDNSQRGILYYMHTLHGISYTYGTSFITDGEKQPLIGVSGKSFYLKSIMFILSNFIFSTIYLLLDVF